MLRQVIEAWDLLDSADVGGEDVASRLQERGAKLVKVDRVHGRRGFTDFIETTIVGTNGQRRGGDRPTLGIIGQLGGVGARPEVQGLVSDADGAVTALATALKLLDMQRRGDLLDGDVVVTTHVCPQAPTIPHEPVPFMGSPVDIETSMEYLVEEGMAAILSIDTTRGNRVINRRGFAITPTVKRGYVLRVSEALLDLMSYVTGCMPAVVPITTQDITPYGNGVFHINSIMQPAAWTRAAVVGVALTSEVPVPGCASGASQPLDIEGAARFCVEVAKSFTSESISLYDEDEYRLIQQLYGSMDHLQTKGGGEGLA